MKTPETEDPVWELLSHASTAEPGPFFSRDVVREARKAGSGISFLERLQGALGPKLLVPGAVGAAVAVIVAISIERDDSSLSPAPASPGIVLESDASFDPASEMEAVEYLGELMAVADPGQLSEDAIADLFF